MLKNQHPALREGLVTLLLGFAVVLVIMNTMMFNLALPAVAKGFSRTPAQASWIVTGYSIVFAIASITYSRLADFIPIGRLFVIALLSLGSAAIAGFFTQDFTLLLIVRILQAAGAGGIPGLALVLISRYIPLERRGRAIAAVMSAVSLGLGLGPVVGGAIVEYLGWHYLFLLTAAALLLVPFFLRLIPRETPRQGTFDAFGALLAGTAITGLLLAMTAKSPLALGVAVGIGFLFVLRIRSAKEPFVLPVLFRNRSYLTLASVGIAAYLCSFSTLFLLPQILVHHFEMSAMHAGLVIFPGSCLAMLFSPLVGKIIDRQGNAAIIRFAPALVLVSTVLFALFAHVSFISVTMIYILLSLGFTFLTSSVSNEMSRLLSPAQMGSGLGLFQLLQFFSGALGVATTASALVWQKEMPFASAFANIFWGMSALIAASLVSGGFYLRQKVRPASAA